MSNGSTAYQHRDAAFRETLERTLRQPGRDHSVKAETDMDNATITSKVPSRQPDTVTAIASRAAGRINAANVSEAEYERLLAERQALLDALFDGHQSRDQARRLAYVRWSLDRIDDARNGPVLDQLEEAIARYERFRGDLERFQTELATALPRKK